MQLFGIVYFGTIGTVRNPFTLQNRSVSRVERCSHGFWYLLHVFVVVVVLVRRVLVAMRL
jgi:hypothetical protein